MLSAVNGGGLTIVVGIIVVQAVSWVVAVFGMKFFHHYERRVMNPCSSPPPISPFSVTNYRVSDFDPNR